MSIAGAIPSGAQARHHPDISRLLLVLLWRPRLTWLLLRWVGVHLPRMLVRLPSLWRQVRRLLRGL